jgi:hypothetical protein
VKVLTANQIWKECQEELVPFVGNFIGVRLAEEEGSCEYQLVLYVLLTVRLDLCV